MPNPHGNPEIKKYGFTTDRDEPLTEKLNIRLTKSMMAELKELENVPEFVKQAIKRNSTHRKENKLIIQLLNPNCQVKSAIAPPQSLIISLRTPIVEQKESSLHLKP